MPTVSLTLPDISQSVFRPVVIDVVTQLKQWTKIDENVPIFYKNEAGQLFTAGSSMDAKDDRNMLSEAIRRLDVSAEEVYAEDQQITDVSGRLGNFPVITDDKLGVWFAASPTSSTVTLEMEFRTRSKEEARRWRDDVTIRYIQGRYALEHQVKYSYNLPAPAWNLLVEIWRKREAVAGYGETFSEYLKRVGTNRLIPISNEVGTQQQITVAESQDRIQGFFSFTNNPDKADYDKETGTHIIRFQYTFTYQRPSGLDLHYPISVHQQLLDARFIDFVTKRPEVDDRAHTRSQFLWGAKQFEKGEIQRMMKPRAPFIRIPEFDQFPTNYAFPGTAAYLIVLCLQGKDETLAFNMKELGDIVIDRDILDFLKTEYIHIGKPGKSIFHFDVYRGKDLCALPAVTMDQDLNIHFNMEIDLRKQYRVRCAVYTDLSYIDKAALERLCAHPKAFQKVFAGINELLRLDSSFQKLGDQRRIEPWQLTKLYEAVMGQGVTNIYSGQTRSWLMGGHGTNIASQARTFMSDIPESVLRSYRTARKTRMDSQVLGIAAFRDSK